MKKELDIRNQRLMERAKELTLKNREATVSAFKRRPSGFYTADHILFYIAAAANIIIYIINFFACQLALEMYTAIDVGKKTQFRNMSAIAAVLLFAAIVLIIFKVGKDKCYVFSFAAGLIATIPMTTMFILGKEAIQLFNSPLKYFLVYAAPSLVMLFSIGHIFFVILSEKRAISKKYDDIVNSIYEQHKDDDSIMTGAEWDKAIEDYVDNPYGKEKMKKSLRRKKEIIDNEAEEE